VDSAGGGPTAWIQDLGSSNGTFVNGIVLPGGKDARPTQLHEGDTVDFGVDMLVKGKLVYARIRCRVALQCVDLALAAAGMPDVNTATQIKSDGTRSLQAEALAMLEQELARARQDAEDMSALLEGGFLKERTSQSVEAVAAQASRQASLEQEIQELKRSVAEAFVMHAQAQDEAQRGAEALRSECDRLKASLLDAKAGIAVNGPSKVHVTTSPSSSREASLENLYKVHSTSTQPSKSVAKCSGQGGGSWLVCCFVFRQLVHESANLLTNIGTINHTYRSHLLPAHW
jgi:F0F1-type ATP synthase epsilon subunit